MKRIWAVEGPVRGPHPRPAPRARRQLRLGADALHARSDLCPRRAADVLQHVPRRLHLPRQTPGELGHAAANLGGRRRDLHRGHQGRLLDLQVSREGATPGPEFIRFSTTRPETMLGDTAVCVHPSDERYKHLIGKTVTIPLVNRDIPIIADGLLADPTLGTGCVKVTPAHDPNDYACWQRNPPHRHHQHPQPRRHDQRERRQVQGPRPLQGPRSRDRRHGSARPVRGQGGPR